MMMIQMKMTRLAMKSVSEQAQQSIQETCTDDPKDIKVTSRQCQGV